MGFLIIAFLISLILTGLYRKYAIRKSIIDIPNIRSSHTIPTPRGGGIALAFAWFTGLIYFFITGKIGNDLFFALLSGLPLVLIGFMDDMFNLGPWFKLLVQMACAAAALVFLDGLSVIQLGSHNFVYPIVFTFIAGIAIVWAINLFNFLDGIDGYITSEIIFIGISSYLLTGDQVGVLLASVSAGFLFWNWEKARIFMGDAGSTLIGYNVAILAIYHQNNHISNLPVWLILSSVFWVDATVTIYRRVNNREKLSVAHRKHAYQRIVQAGFSHQKTVISAFIINLLCLGLAWMAFEFVRWDWLFLFTDLILLYLVIKYIDNVKPFEYA